MPWVCVTAGEQRKMALTGLDNSTLLHYLTLLSSPSFPLTIDYLVGTWGKESFDHVPPPAMRSTMSAEVFDLTPKLLAQEMENNKFAKFVSLQLYRFL